MDLKRKQMEQAIVPVTKKTKTDMVAYGDHANVLNQTPGRTSNLQAPIMLLSGHEGEVFCTKFSHDGSIIVSAGMDRQILLWNTFGDCDNWAHMTGHTGAILELQYSTDSSQLVSCSTDKTLGLWDLGSCQRIRKFRGHQSFVNSCSIARRGPQLLCSGSDDGTIKLWDSRKKVPIDSFQNTYQATACCLSDTAEQIISGGIDNDIKVWDLRKKDVLYRMRGHSDTVTGMELSADGSYLLTTAMDNTVRIWDVRPFAPAERCVKIFQGHQHTFEKNLLRCGWSPDGGKITSGSGDRFVYIWDTTTRRVIYKLPGHTGSVNEVDFHPTEPIIVSCSSDKKVYLGEIEP